jgi:DnaK suppressor protein
MARSNKKKASRKPIKKRAPSRAGAKKTRAVRKEKALARSKKTRVARKATKPAGKAATRSKKPSATAKKRSIVARKPARSTKTSKPAPHKNSAVPGRGRNMRTVLGNNYRQRRLDPFTRAQKDKLLQLRDAMVDSMAGVAQDTLRSRAEGNEASAFGMHQADAGSDAYDRDFALSLLSQEQDALYEIDQALKRVELGTYGVCEMSGKAIPHARLEAIPFARFTVECQSQLEKQNKASRVRQSVTSLFGLTDEEKSENEEEEPAAADNKE